MSATDIKTIQFNDESSFRLWKDNTSNISFIDINFVSNSQSNDKFVPKVQSLILSKNQTNFSIIIDDEFILGEDKVKVFLNGEKLIVSTDYIEVDTKTIKISRLLKKNDLLVVLVDNGFFETIDSNLILETFSVIVTYNELNTSIAEITNFNLNLNLDGAGIEITWEDIFGRNLDEAIGTDWKERDGFKGNIEYMDFVDWKGVVIIRKEGSQPESIDDGEKVITVTKPNQYMYVPFLDKADHLILGKTYFYKAFPYDSGYNYNTNLDSESIVFDISTLPITNNARFDIDKTASGELTIKWTDPEMNRWKGTKVIGNNVRKPVNELDGNVIIDNSIKNKYSKVGYIINGLPDNQEYFIGIFAYDEEGNHFKILTTSSTPVPTLSNILIDFSRDDWRNYFQEISIAKVIDSPELNKAGLLIKPTYMDTSSVYEVSYSLKMKPVFFNRKGGIVIRFKTRSNSLGGFEVNTRNIVSNKKSSFKNSGYYIDFKFQRFFVDAGEHELSFTLTCYDINTQVLIDYIEFER